MDVIKVAILGIAGLTLCLMVREVRPEYAFYVSFATGLCILLLATGKLQYLLDMLQGLEAYIPIDTTYLHALMKIVGITYVGQFSSALCKDAGYASIAGQIEIFSKLSILAISMPVLTALMDTIQGFLV